MRVASFALALGIASLWAGCAGSQESPEGDPGDPVDRPATEPLHWSHQVASVLRPDTAEDNSWIEGVSSQAASGNWYSKMTAKWTVPVAPVDSYTSSPQMFNSVWPGLEDAAGSIVAQPVLYYGYGPDGGGNSWSFECYFSTTTGDVHSTAITVHPGDSLSATISSTGCNASGGNCTWTCTANDVTTGGSTSKSDTLTQTLNTAWSILEVSDLTTCADFPDNGPTTISSIALYDKTGAAATPSWTVTNYTSDQGVPCGFGASDTSTSVTLKYAGWQCDPTKMLPHLCCAYAGGCTCEGREACSASGVLGACVGSTPAGGNPIDCN